MNIEGWNNSAPGPSDFVDLEAAECGIITRCRDVEEQDSWIGNDESLKIWEQVLDASELRIPSFKEDGYDPWRLVAVIRSAREIIKLRKQIENFLE